MENKENKNLSEILGLDNFKKKGQLFNNNILKLTTFKHAQNQYTFLIEVSLNANKKIYLSKSNNEKEFKKINSTELSTMKYSNLYRYYCSNIDLIKLLCTVKIKDYKESSTLFGLGPSKKRMYEQSLNGETFFINEILMDYPCKYNNQERNIVEVINNNRALKFTVEDLEFIYPDISKLLKGINFPKDRTITRDKVVVVKRGNYKGITGKVVELNHISDSKTYAIIDIGDSKKIINLKHLKIK